MVYVDTRNESAEGNGVRLNKYLLAFATMFSMAIAVGLLKLFEIIVEMVKGKRKWRW